MPYYHHLGEIPPKRHTIFRKPDQQLYAEELVSTEGFSNVYSLVYHCHPPTLVKSIGTPYNIAPKAGRTHFLKHTSLKGFNIPAEDDYLASRKILLFNSDLHIALAAPRHSMKDYFYKNTQADEILFVHKGKGMLKTGYGEIPFAYGDYLVIPRGIIYQIQFETRDNRLLIVESFSPVQIPKRYRNMAGQMMEHAPFCERDLKIPLNLQTIDQKGDFKVLIKKQDYIYPYTYGSHPFDFIGWDGFHYPWGFSIHDFEPITGRLHMPPPIHQTFESSGFVLCSFCPRMFDYHPQSIPAPYNHSNIDSDEILYYVDGDFMSRKNVEQGQMTLHPAGIPHGPHPGTVEKSIGKKFTEELAVMIDPFHPMALSEEALMIEDESYYTTWMDDLN